LSDGNQEVIKIFIDVMRNDRPRLGKWATVAQKYLDFYGKNKFERHWTADDILQEVIERIFTEKRNYNEKAYKGIDDFIYKTIRSVIEDSFRSRNKVEPSEEYVETDEGGDYKNKFEKKHRTPPDYIQIEFEINEKLEKCYNELLQDEDAALVFLEWKKGNTSKDIADELGMKLPDVESAKKRIRYKLTNNQKS